MSTGGVDPAPSSGAPRWLVNGLLSLSAALLVLTAAMGFYLVRNRRQIESTRAELLSRAELQKELLRAQPEDLAVFPHDDPRIGYVLNPALRRATWHAPDGGAYPVNSLGLRGEEIPPKMPGRTRVLIVGDSVVFGWKLPDEDRLSSVMARYLRESGAGDAVEVHTVALPGWNVVAEHAFLESYARRLDPDAVVWSVLPNDVFDVAGVVPPGRLQFSVSSQRQRFTPFTAGTGAHGLRLVPLPSILERWDRNLSLIESYRRRFGVPVVLLNFESERMLLLEDGLRRTGAELPVVTVPLAFYEDPRWGVSDLDRHPTPWANSRLAAALLARLAELGIVPPLAFEGEELAAVGAFEAASEPASPEEIDRFYAEMAEAVPLSADQQATYDDNALFGLHDGKMQKNGLLFLRAPRPAQSLRLRLSSPAGRPAVPATLSLELRGLGGDVRRQSFELPTGETEVEIPLPATDPERPVFELSWEFDLLVCVGALDCDGATRLEAIAFRGGSS